jgi:hypothetical protein
MSEKEISRSIHKIEINVKAKGRNNLGATNISKQLCVDRLLAEKGVKPKAIMSHFFFKTKRIDSCTR